MRRQRENVQTWAGAAHTLTLGPSRPLAHTHVLLTLLGMRGLAQPGLHSAGAWTGGAICPDLCVERGGVSAPTAPCSDPTGIPGGPRSCLCRKNVSSHLSGQILKFMFWNSLGSEEARKASTRGFKLKIWRRAENSTYSKKKRGGLCCCPTKGSELGCWGCCERIWALQSIGRMAQQDCSPRPTSPTVG